MSVLWVSLIACLFGVAVESFQPVIHHSICPEWTRSPSTIPKRSSSPFRLFAFYKEDDYEDDDDEDDEEYIDDASLGDWRMFRRNLAAAAALEAESSSDRDPQQQQTKQQTTATSTTSATKSVSKENEQVLAQQNKALAKEYTQGVWAHPTSMPEVGGLVVRLPLEVELHRNPRRSLNGRKLSHLLQDAGKDDIQNYQWYARAQQLIEGGMKAIALQADADSGVLEAAHLPDDLSELLNLYLDHQETWQEVCLVVHRDEANGTAKTVVLNRPMAMKLTENLARLVYYGSMLKATDIARDMSRQKALVKFLMAFGNECAVYVGGPQLQNDPALLVHGIADLPGAVEISPGSNLYTGGLEAAVQGVLDGKYSPLEFRFFVGCHEYAESALDVAVHLGKYQPVACARSVALKQCISLPKPLWNEVCELCGGELEDVATFERMKREDIKFQVIDEERTLGYTNEEGEEDYFEDDDDDDEMFFR